MSKINICNRALSYLTTKTIVSFDGVGREERLCNLFYDVTLEELLRMHPFNFAMDVRQLSPVLDVPTNGWGYAYIYPANAIDIKSVTTSPRSNITSFHVGGSSSMVEDGTKFGIGVSSYDNKKYIYTDILNPFINYVKKVTDTSLFDPLFRQAFEHFLAYKMSLPLTGNQKITQQLFGYFIGSFEQAKAGNASEGNSVEFAFDKYINAR
jgi:hypothetical protein